MRTFGWTALLLFASSLACAGSAAQREPTTGPGESIARSGDGSSPGGPTEAPAPGATASSESELDEPVVDPEPSHESAARGEEGATDCAKVCDMLAKCTPRPLPECNARCMSSHLREEQQQRCLAARILWIDEEGCKKMLETYDSFVGNDDCKH